MTSARTGLDEGRAALALQVSRRSAVPSFIVMDVMEAAAAREWMKSASGDDIAESRSAVIERGRTEVR